MKQTIRMCITKMLSCIAVMSVVVGMGMSMNHKCFQTSVLRHQPSDIFPFIIPHPSAFIHHPSAFIHHPPAFSPLSESIYTISAQISLYTYALDYNYYSYNKHNYPYNHNHLK